MKSENYEPDASKDQHIMEDGEILERMVLLGEVKGGDHVLEIGPATGNLTRHILKTGAKVTAVERDKNFERILKREFSNEKNFELIFGNALDVMGKIRFNKLISNIPYSICEPLINKLMRKDFDLAVLSLPEGFARILLARPNERRYSKLSLKSQSFFRVSIEFKIPRSAFKPEPRTESVIAVIKPLSKNDYLKNHEKYVLREIFLQPKMKLKNALREAIINLNKNILGRNFTKNLAREVIRGMKLEKDMLEKRVNEMNTKDFRKLLCSLSL